MALSDKMFWVVSFKTALALAPTHLGNIFMALDKGTQALPHPFVECSGAERIALEDIAVSVTGKRWCTLRQF